MYKDVPSPTSTLRLLVMLQAKPNNTLSNVQAVADGICVMLWMISVSVVLDMCKQFGIHIENPVVLNWKVPRGC